MKPIKFQELHWRNNKLMALFYLLALAFILPNLFDVWDFLEPQMVKFLTAFFSVGMLIHSLRQFTHKHYVQWNKRGITIRVNSLFGINFGFADVKDIVYSNNAYTVYLRSKRSRTINLEGVEQESKERLLGILQSHTLAPVKAANV